MSWFGWGSKKKASPEEKHKVKLDQLEKLGFTDRKKNLTLLQQYGGNVNMVIQDYKTMDPSSSVSPAQKPKPKVKPTQPSKPKVVQKVATPVVDPKPKVQIDPKVKPKKQSMSKPVVSKQVSEQKEAPKSNESSKVTSKVSSKVAQPKPSKPTVKAIQPIMPNLSTSKTKKVPKMLFNLRDLVSSDVRQLLLNIGEPVIAEIILSNAIDGEQFYQFIVVNPLLKKFNVSFASDVDYTTLVNQCELSYQKHGAVDIYNKSKPSDDLKTDFQPSMEQKSDTDSHSILKQNVATLVASDVRLLVLPYCPELAERLYAYSISGAEFVTFSYDTVIFTSGMSPKDLSKDVWSKIQSECNLKPQPFDAKKWSALRVQQENVIAAAERAKETVHEIKKQLKKPKVKPQQKVQNKPQRKPIKVVCPKPPSHQQKHLQKKQQAQIKRVHQMDKELDATMSAPLRTLKQRQLQTLTTLHDIAAVLGMSASTVSEIEQFARRESEKEMARYLKNSKNSSGNITTSSISSKSSNSLEDLEQRQLKLLSTLDKQQRILAKLAKSRGVSMEELQAAGGVTDLIMNGQKEYTVHDVAVMDKQLDVLFQSLAKIAESVQQTAAKYKVPMDSKEAQSVEKHLEPMFKALAGKQEALIENLEYMNDQARMINPKAVEVNEQILHISGQGHRRSSSGQKRLSVPHSPGGSPTPHDHFPDTRESLDKGAYDEHSEHPKSLQSRSPSISTGAIKISTPDETAREANQVRQRRKSLMHNANALSLIVMRMEGKGGYLTVDQLKQALREAHVSANVEEMDLVMRDITDDQGVSTKKLMGYLGDQHSTLKMDSCRQWNSFRMKVIKAKQ